MKSPTRHPLAVANMVTAALALVAAIGASGTRALAEMIVVSTVPTAGMQQFPADLPVSASQGFWNPDQDGPCITPAQHAEIEAYLAANVADLKARGLLPETPDKAAGVLLQWPVKAAPGLDDPGVHGISNFVDENLAYPNQVRDYNCGTRTYDNASAYNHAGTDIFSWPFPWYRMDHDQVQVVAAAPGVIIGKDDGNYDRRCSGSGLLWNAVYVQHADGSVAARQRDRARMRFRVGEILRDMLDRRMRSDDGQWLDGLLDPVIARESDPYALAEQMLERAGG